MPEPHCWLSWTLVNWAMESVFLNEYHYFFPGSPHHSVLFWVLESYSMLLVPRVGWEGRLCSSLTPSLLEPLPSCRHNVCGEGSFLPCPGQAHSMSWQGCFSISSQKIYVPTITSPRGFLSTWSLPEIGQNASHHTLPYTWGYRVSERSPACLGPHHSEVLEPGFEPMSAICYP